VAFFIGQAFAHPSVNYVVTVPGPAGDLVAFVAEFIIAFFLMLAVLFISNMPGLARWTGGFAGCLVAIYITFEAPFSGMSMNPARTFGSAAVASFWAGLWIYFAAPVLAMSLPRNFMCAQNALSIAPSFTITTARAAFSTAASVDSSAKNRNEPPPLHRSTRIDPHSSRLRIQRRSPG
jgi:hypothetical protein